MTWDLIIKKLGSRKFWVAVAGIIAGIVVAFGGDEGEISQISGTVTSVIFGLSYIFAEASVDKASVKANAETVLLVDDGDKGVEE